VPTGSIEAYGWHVTRLTSMMADDDGGDVLRQLRQDRHVGVRLGGHRRQLVAHCVGADDVAQSDACVGRQPYRIRRHAGRGLLRVVVVAAMAMAMASACSSGGNDSIKSSTASESGPPTTKTTAAAPSCATAAQLAHARLVDDALAAYATAAATDSTCDPENEERQALALIKGRVELLRAAANAALATKKDTVAARQALTDAIALDAGDESLRDSLAALDEPSPITTMADHFAAAERLDRAGYREAAKAEVVAGLKEKPLPDTVRDRLDENPSWLGQVWQALSGAWSTIITGIGLLVALLSIRRWAQGRGLRQSAKRKKTKWNLFGRPRSRVIVGGAVGDDAAILGPLVRDHLRKLAGAPTPARAEISGLADVNLGLPPLEDVDSRLKGAVAVLKWSLRPDDLHVTPVLTEHSASARQAAAVEVRDDWHSSSTKWTLPLVSDSTTAVQVAAAHAAGWAAFEIRRLRPHLPAPVGVEPDTPAESFAANLAGAAAFDLGEVSVAEGLFSVAVDADSKNPAARNNSAVVLAAHGDVPSMEAAAQILRDLVEDLDR